MSLNTHSRVAVRLGAHAREVRLLRGEALFHVAHDPSRPFLVSTDDAVVQAVGTQFDVYRRDDGTVVAVLEGRVNVTTAAAGARGERQRGSARCGPRGAQGGRRSKPRREPGGASEPRGLSQHS